MSAGGARALWRRALAIAFFSLVAYLLWRYGRRVEWHAVGRSLRDLSPVTLVLALGCAVPALLLFSSYDLLGRAYTGHRLPVRQVMAVNFISYAFNLNLGALVGGFALRYRLYGRLGLSPGVVTEVLGVSLLTNWLGWTAVAGAVFLLHPLALPGSWPVNAAALQLFGGLLLLAPLGYFLLCGFARRREWWFKGRRIALPTARIALLQLLMACGHWLFLGALVNLLLPPEAPYLTVLAVLLLAAIAGVIAHVPAGLGVVEAVFLALLTPTIAEHTLLAGLVAYRALYYLLPLLVAAIALLVMELPSRRRV